MSLTAVDIGRSPFLLLQPPLAQALGHKRLYKQNREEEKGSSFLLIEIAPDSSSVGSKSSSMTVRGKTLTATHLAYSHALFELDSSQMLHDDSIVFVQPQTHMRVLGVA